MKLALPIYDIYFASSLFLFLCVTNYAETSRTQPFVNINNYANTFFVAYDKNKNYYAVIRSFSSGGSEKYLVVDPLSLITKVVAVQELKKCGTSLSSTLFAKTPYGKALKKFSKPPYEAENYGLKTSQSPVRGVYLTIDMCPSAKAFEKPFFVNLVEQGKLSPLPVAISLTGKWALNHPMEFDWLIKQQNENKLNITWINHSYHHQYPEKMIDKASFAKEVLLVEKLLLSKGQSPSVFFRFPALISDKDAVLKLHELGLIPVASDAWLAKKQKAKAGSIILVHGNANEPAGIQLVTQFLKTNSALRLLPLTDAPCEKNDRKLNTRFFCTGK